MSDRREEIQSEQVPLKSDADPEKLKIETNSAKVFFLNLFSDFLALIYHQATKEIVTAPKMFPVGKLK